MSKKKRIPMAQIRKLVQKNEPFTFNTKSERKDVLLVCNILGISFKTFSREDGSFIAYPESQITTK